MCFDYVNKSLRLILYCGGKKNPSVCFKKIGEISFLSF